MPPSTHMEIRPRTTGEILDDAWRLYRTDPCLLLAASGLFLLPAASVLLLVLTQPLGDSPWTRWLWPTLATLLLPLTGLGAGACEEAFHLWTEDRPVNLSRCLSAAWRRGLNHVASEALVLLLPLFGLLWLGAASIPPPVQWTLLLFCLLFNVPVWILGFSRHAVLTAGQKNLWRAWRLSRRATGRHFGRVVLLVFGRVVLLAAVAINLHLFLQLGFYAAEVFAGLDVAYLRLLLSPGNPTYLLILLSVAWWLLAPWNEAVNYLFIVDARTRYDGLDLWYRIEEYFPQGTPAKVSALFLVIGAALLAAAPVQAQERLQAVQTARKELATITREVKEADPYPGGSRWLAPLRDVGRRLDPEGLGERGRYRWFSQIVEHFGERDRAADQKILQDLDARLALVEQSLKWQPYAQRHGGEVGEAPSAEQIRRLVPRLSKGLPKERSERKPPAEQEPPPRRQDDANQVRPTGRGGPAIMAPPAVGGLGYLCLSVCVVLLVAVLVIGVAMLLRAWIRRQPLPKPGQRGVSEPGLEDVLTEPDRQNVASLWRQSDELARAGRFLDAVRTLYLAVLALLHQANLIRYERTRTNGEYADQLRRKGSPVQRPFKGLTSIFEVKWYGERACQQEDYQTCRGLAETIQRDARSPTPTTAN